MKKLLLCIAISALSASALISAENAVLIDIKSPINQKLDLEPALNALRFCISDDNRFKVVMFGSDWKIWLKDYVKHDNGEVCNVSLKMSLVAPSSSSRNSPLAVADVSYRFPKEPRDILTTEDSTMRFLRGKATDLSKEKLAEMHASYSAISEAFRSLIPAMREFELNRGNKLKFRSQDL